MYLGIREKVALVTASSKGMGKAIASALANEGVRLSLCARGSEQLEQSAGEIRQQAGVDVLTTPADVSRPSDIQHLVERTLGHFGQVDILVCNAGGPPPGSFADFPDDEPWENAFHQNLMSVVRLSRAVIPSMIEKRWGRILTVTSVTVKEPRLDLVLSNVMRSGVASLVKSLATEYGPHGILVNNVLPNAVLTDRFLDLARRASSLKQISLDDYLGQTASQIPLRRIASPEEFAQMVVFLASERAGYITGTTIAVDGGAIRAVM